MNHFSASGCWRRRLVIFQRKLAKAAKTQRENLDWTRLLLRVWASGNINDLRLFPAKTARLVVRFIHAFSSASFVFLRWFRGGRAFGSDGAGMDAVSRAEWNRGKRDDVDSGHLDR